MKKPKTLFDHLAGITHKKVKWEELDDTDRKSFTPYLINRWLSMSPELIEIVDMFQHYTIGPLSKEHVYKLYYDILPKGKFFTKYIKGKKSNKYNPELINLLREFFEVSKREIEDLIPLMDSNDIISISKKYGKTEKQIKQWLK
jgi:hypothetical protein